MVKLTAAADWALRAAEGELEPRWIGLLLACASTYMIITGLVYNLLLRGIELPQGTTLVWANEVLHLIGPLFMVADMFLAPGRRHLPWRALAMIVAFPVVWVGYTLVRGPLITSPGTGMPYWYPYPFLDPNGPGGYASVAVYIVGIAVAILTVGSGVVRVSRRRDATWREVRR